MANKDRNNQRRYPSRQSHNPQRTAKHINNSPQAIKEQQAEPESGNNNRIRYKDFITADKIAIWSVSVNIVLAFVTFLLFHIASNEAGSATTSANAAIKSVGIADKTYKSDSANNQNIFLLQKNANKSADNESKRKSKIDSQTFKLQDSSFKAQIASIQETQTEFELENRPFIAIGNITIDTPTIGKKMYYSALIGNAGKQPAFIINAKYQFLTSTDSLYNRLDNIPNGDGIKNDYLPNNMTVPVNSSSLNAITEADYKHTKGIQYYLYFRAIIEYRGIEKSKKYSMDCIYRVTIDEKKAAKTVRYDIK
jgi:hypothetical protein